MNGQNPFAINYGQGQQQQSPLMGLAGLVNQYAAMQQQQPEQVNAFASQTPGAPQQPGRIDQTSFVPQQQSQGMAGGLGAAAATNPFWLLSQNIAKRFGI